LSSFNNRDLNLGSQSPDDEMNETYGGDNQFNKVCRKLKTIENTDAMKNTYCIDDEGKSI